MPAAVIDVAEVVPFRPDPAVLTAFHIECPLAWSSAEGLTVAVAGWALAAAEPIEAIELVSGALVIQRVALSVPRPDVVSAYPGHPRAAACGFSATIGALGLPAECEVLVRARLHDGRSAALAMVTIRRAPLVAAHEPRLTALLVTMLGRTGSTWLMRLLSLHPEVVVHPSQHYETRAGSYWLHMLKMLSEPENQPYLHEPAGHFHLTDDPRLEAWHSGPQLQRTTSFCLDSLQRFYAEVAAAEGAEEARYFAEKYHPDHVPTLLRELWPSAREILLVRDLRDVLCSIRSINAKRGTQDFGRNLVDSDERYIREHLAREAQLLLDAWEQRRERTVLVRYEDLILEPVQTLERVLSAVGLDARPSLIERLMRLAFSDTAELAFHRTTRMPRASVGRWRTDLDPELCAVCEEAFGDVLDQFGYERGRASLRRARPALAP